MLIAVHIQFLVRDLLASLEHDRAFIITMLVKPRFGLSESMPSGAENCTYCLVLTSSHA